MSLPTLTVARVPAALTDDSHRFGALAARSDGTSVATRGILGALSGLSTSPTGCCRYPRMNHGLLGSTNFQSARTEFVDTTYVKWEDG